LLRIYLLSLIALLLATGCSGVHNIQVPEEEGNWVTESGMSDPSRMYTRHEEEKYVIKPEPYSLSSKKKDPELLGPQRTYQAGNTPSQSSSAAPRRRSRAGMSKASCISMIGQAKYNSYVKKYGGEKGALRRCLILKRLKG